jgi:tRNA-Thr(GGU) m(6)t(6)A37 methyltransferase TsaA
MNSFIVRAIGIIHSPFLSRDDAPRQGKLSDALITIEVLPEFAEGLQDIEKEPHHIVLYWLDRSDRNKLKAIPPHTGTKHGVFATRSSARPNPIGICIVELIRREETCFLCEVLMRLMEHHYLILNPTRQISIRQNNKRSLFFAGISTSLLYAKDN